MSSGQPGVSLEARAPAYSWYALVLLTFVYVLNFLDRTLIYILFTPIKKEMEFSDLQLALLGTTSFVIFYTLLGSPFRTPRRPLAEEEPDRRGLAVWSLFSGLTGFADSFWSLFFCRVMVGVGEATLGPAALSLLSDYFPPRMRATVQAIYSSGIAIGGGLAFFLGGWIGQAYGWRWAFYLLGFPGLVLAVLVFLLREPPRGQHGGRGVRSAGTTGRSSSAPFRCAICTPATRCSGSPPNNLGIWLTTFFVRVHDVSLRRSAWRAGSLRRRRHPGHDPRRLLLADRFRGGSAGGRMAFTACAALVSVPLWLGLLFATTSACCWP